MYKGKKCNIFICYRGRKDGQGDAAAACLYKGLNEIAEFKPFYADGILVAGVDNFKNASRQVLEETKVFILLLTPGFFDECSHRDDMVKDEIQTALNNARIRLIPIVLPGFDAKREFTKEVSDLFEGNFEDRIEHVSPIEWHDPGRFEIKDQLVRMISRILDDCDEDNAVAQAASDDMAIGKGADIKTAYLTIKNGVLTECNRKVKGELIIPHGVPSIGAHAFDGCTSLTSVIIPDSVTDIGDIAFQGCTSLASVTIGNGVTSIGVGAFWGCKSLTSVAIGKSVTSIGNAAFGYCTSLTSVAIPNSVKSIGKAAFYGCDSLKSVYITDIKKWLAIDFSDEFVNPLYYAKNLYLNGELVTDLVIPDGVKSIGRKAFCGCDSLTSVTIPNSVTSIKDYAFDGCDSLTSVTIGSGVTSIGISAFSDRTGLTSLHYTGDMASWLEKTWHDKIMSRDLVLYIDGNKLEGEVVIPDGTVAIRADAFSGQTSLTSIVIPNSVTSIEDSAFRGCNSLTSVTIPNSVTSIGISAFSGCTSLVSVTIPDGVTSIGYGAFWGCTSLTSVIIGNGVTSIGGAAFRDCTSLTSIIIPGSVTSIGDQAFGYCPSLERLTVAPGNPKYHSAGNCVIETATGTLIQGCNNSVIPSDGSVTSIGDYAFRGCTSLTSITIPDSVTSIGDHAFDNCTALTSIVIPDSVTSIGAYAFAYCDSLTSVTFDGTKAEWNAVDKGSSWKHNCPFSAVICSDGSVPV